MEGSGAKGNIDKWIGRNDKDQYFRRPCNMMIDETSPSCLVHRCVYLAIDLLEQEAFENIEADCEVVDEDDADDQGTKGCQLGNGL